MAKVVQESCFFIKLLQYRFYNLPAWRPLFVVPQKHDLVGVLPKVTIRYYPLFPPSESAPRQGSVTVTGAYHSHTSQRSSFQQACCTTWHQRPVSSSLFQVSFRGKEAASSTCQSTRSSQPGSNTQTWLRAFGHFEKGTGIIMEQQQFEKWATNLWSMSFKELLLTLLYCATLSVGWAKLPVDVHQNHRTGAVARELSQA